MFGQYNPYFVESYGWFENTNSVFITMEFLPHGDLQDHLSALSTLPESEVQQISFQVLEGLAFMHENDFAHRDLKPSVSTSHIYLDRIRCLAPRTMPKQPVYAILGQNSKHELGNYLPEYNL